MTSAADIESKLRSAIDAIIDPELGRTLGSLRMVKQAAVPGDRATVEIELPTPAYPDRERIAELVRKAAAAVGVQAETRFSWKVKGKESGGNIGLRVKNIIAVGSGKGGVGKSTLAASLACGMRHLGASVGLLDADVYGPSIPHLFGESGELSLKEIKTPDGQVVPRVEPIETASGVKLLSIGFQIAKDQAVVWRGPMLHRQLTLFLQHTDWGELDYLFIDMPPGTGDVALSLSQMVQAAGAVIVCTPQQVALLDAVRAISMFRTVKIPVLGMVENMSGDVFGRGGTRAKAGELGVPFLGELPIEAAVRIKGDDGKIGDLYGESSPVREPLLRICERMAIEVAKQTLEQSSMPTLELL
ncbi:MAG: P-loop NTPase [Planctomycetaceae bacterium]|nr:P-loop NTPase [Planctomycetaceae bacterium]